MPPESNAFVIHEPVVMIRRDRIKIAEGARIDSFVKLEGGTGLEIGRCVHIASFAHVGIGGGTTFIEDYATIASGGRVLSGTNRLDVKHGNTAAPEGTFAVARRVTRIGRYAFVATNGVVLPGVQLGEGAVLAAGGVATHDIPAWEIWAGIPARFIAKRQVRPR